MMIGERDGQTAPSIGISGTIGARTCWLVWPRLGGRPSIFRNAGTRRDTGKSMPPCRRASHGPRCVLFVLLIGSESLVDRRLQRPARLDWRGRPEHADYTEAAIAGLGVAVLFCIDQADDPFVDRQSERARRFFAISVTGTLAALALAELAALGGYAYLSHYLGTTIPPVSFHHWLRAWAMATVDRGPARYRRRPDRRHDGSRRDDWPSGSWSMAAASMAAVSSATWPRAGRTSCSSAAISTTASRHRVETIVGVPWLGDSEQLIDYVREENGRRDRHSASLVGRPAHPRNPAPPSPFARADPPGAGTDRASAPAALAPDAEDAATLDDSRAAPSPNGICSSRACSTGSAAFALLLLLMPTLGMVACLIKLESPGPVFFRQKRLGFNNRPFDVLKFRTMTHGGGPAGRSCARPSAAIGGSRGSGVSCAARASMSCRSSSTCCAARCRWSVRGPIRCGLVPTSFGPIKGTGRSTRYSANTPRAIA